MFEFLFKSFVKLFFFLKNILSFFFFLFKNYCILLYFEALISLYFLTEKFRILKKMLCSVFYGFMSGSILRHDMFLV